MSDPVLHIKDSYYFEVPKILWPSRRATPQDFPDWWVRLDPDFQLWEASRLYDAIIAIPEPKPAEGAKALAPIPDKQHLLASYLHWKHADHHRECVPFDAFLAFDPSQQWFKQRAEHASWEAAWQQVRREAALLNEYSAQWEPAKVEAYNRQLDGKILIPQPFGRPKNLYEPAEGFVISKFMILELVVAVLLVALFARLAALIRRGDRARGRLANLCEAFLVFLRDEVARPAIGKHDADRYLPLLWTVFFFILGCNLLGMLPWAGAPTSAFGVTFGMSCVTLLTVFMSGMARFGPIGFWKNQVPQMGLPWYMAIFIVPMVFVIEVIGLLIRHGVLAVRLLANMVAGHLVLLGILGLALAAAKHGFGSWFVVALISVVASALFSLLELFVAFLQAYIFTFLSALFIGAAIHHH